MNSMTDLTHILLGNSVEPRGNDLVKFKVGLVWFLDINKCILDQTQN